MVFLNSSTLLWKVAAEYCSSEALYNNLYFNSVLNHLSKISKYLGSIIILESILDFTFGSCSLDSSSFLSVSSFFSSSFFSSSFFSSSFFSSSFFSSSFFSSSFFSSSFFSVDSSCFNSFSNSSIFCSNDLTWELFSFYFLFRLLLFLYF